jgi:hypothetical protein
VESDHQLPVSSPQKNTGALPIKLQGHKFN